MTMMMSANEAVSIAGQMMEAIYFGACRESCRMAEEHGAPYANYVGSPIERGLFRFDMVPDFDRSTDLHHLRFEWFALFKDIRTPGMLNSMLTAPPPPSTSCNAKRVHANTNTSRRSISTGEPPLIRVPTRAPDHHFEKRFKRRVPPPPTSPPPPPPSAVSAASQRNRLRSNAISHRRRGGDINVDIALARRPFIDLSNCHSTSANATTDVERSTFIATVLSGAHRRGMRACWASLRVCLYRR